MTTIPLSTAKAKLSEFVNRVRKGESFSITLRGEEVAVLKPAPDKRQEEIAAAIDRIIARSKLTPLNAPGRRKLKIKDMIEEGRM